MNRVLFKEEQKFRQLWILMIFIVSTGFWLYILLQHVIADDAFTKEPGTAWMTAIAGIIPLLFIILFIRLKLTTVVDREGIRCRFAIFQRSYRTFRKKDIIHYEIRKYKPIAEYGGWGIRVGRGKRGSAYNVSGNMGLQLQLADGKKFLIGTQQPESLLKAMDRMMEKAIAQ